jgi:hypothetical protein
VVKTQRLARRLSFHLVGTAQVLCEQQYTFQTSCPVH